MPVDNLDTQSGLLTSAGYYLVLSPLEIDSAGYVVRVEHSKLTAYEPFMYYTAPVPQEKVEYVLGRSKDKKKKTPPLKLHTLFASLSPEKPEQLLRFMNTFGCLYYAERPMPPPPYGLTRWYRPTRERRLLTHRPEPMTNYLAELCLFRWVSEVSDLYKRGKAESLARCLDEGCAMVRNGKAPLWQHLWEMLWENAILPEHDLFNRAENLLDVVFTEQLARTSPHISTEKSKDPALSWRFDSLIAAMYLMLLLDLTGGRTLRKCENERCGMFFMPSRREDQIYCTPTCQERAKQRRYINEMRAGEREVRQMLLAGSSREEVRATMLARGHKPNRVVRWIEEVEERIRGI